MEKEFVPYEQALALKELGFDEPCLFWYNLSDDNKLATNAQFDSYNPVTYTNTTIPKKSSYNKELKSITAPLYQQAFRWFREKYNLHQIVLADEKGKYDIIVGERISGSCLGQYETYEEAELECLKKLIEIVKTK